MSFLHPEFLYFMLPPLVILFALLLTQKDANELFFSEEVMRKLRVSMNTLTLKARNGLFFLIGFLLIIALAQPVIKDGKIDVKAKSADIMIALDISHSMLAEDIYPNRLENAKRKAIEFIKLAQNERVGVVAFAKNSYLVAPFSFDGSAVSFLLDKLNTSSMSEQGSDFFSLLEVVAKTSGDKKEKYLLIITDGGDSQDFSKEIAYAKEHGMKIFILGVATVKGAPIRLKNGEFITYKNEIIISKLNENIASLATKTGGVYIETTRSNQDVETMFSEIEKVAIQKELKSQQIEKYIPLFYYPVGLALFVLLIATSSMSKREKVHVPSAFLLFALFSFSPPLHAMHFDFQELEEAKSAYEKGEYARSAELYNAHAMKSKNAQSFYNAGNAYYKQGKFDAAIEHYNKANFTDKEMRAKKYANLGNAYAKSQKFNEAIESYETSLSLVADKETQENLELVKKAQQEQKKQEQQKQDQNKQDTNKEKNKDQNQEKQQNQDQQNQENQNQDQQNQESSKENQKQEQQEQQNSSNQSQENSSDQNSSKQEQQQQKEEENKPQETPKEEQNMDANTTQQEQQMMQKEDGENAQEATISDAEAKKYLDALNAKSRTYLYRLNTPKPQKENTDEKPW
jgi:Ca-activated chloride channel family protein